MARDLIAEFVQGLRAQAAKLLEEAARRPESPADAMDVAVRGLFGVQLEELADALDQGVNDE